jgi:Asp-tRNA(Asn)/Glu-tRNA(Gln) amidotransferase B subunit
MKKIELRQIIREETKRMQKLAGIIKENKITNDMVKDYWSIMVNNQPETVIEILVQLTKGDFSSQEFIKSTVDDIYDSFRDELNYDEDED